MDKKKTRLLVIIGIVVVLIITIAFSIPFLKFINNPDKLRTLIESYGNLAPLMFILLSMIQIIIPFIPGEPFELLAGYIFGDIKGTLLCLFAGSLASIIIILLVKKYGTKLVEVFFSKKDIEKLNFLKTKKAFFIFAIAFILPGTPKDLLCYVGGLANFELVPLILVTTIGRIPGIITSTIPGNAFGEKKYLTGIIIYGITAIICLISLYIYNKVVNKKSN